MISIFRKIATLAIAFVMFGCGNPIGSRFSVAELDTLYAPKYSNRFVLYKCGESSILSIRETDSTYKHIFLSRNRQAPPNGFEGRTLFIPLERVICMSTTHIAMLEKIGHLDKVVGISGCQYVTSSKVREALEQEKIRDIGYESGLNYELATIMRPNAIFVYGTQGDNAASTKKMTELGLPTMFLYEYLENDPLGKAEWLIALSEMFDSRPLAESIFQEVERNYNEVKSLITEEVKRPSVMLNSPWRDTWFIPGDRSYMVQLLNDAGADYICKGYDSELSRSISTEQAFVLCSKADFWLCPSEANSIPYLTASNPRFADIPAVRNNRVFNNNRITTPMGGSDFWESGTINPDVILKDLIRILHPQLLPEHELHYFHQLK